MKTLLRSYLINLAAIWVTSVILPGLRLTGGARALLISAFGLMIVNIVVIPLLKIMFLPLNLLTLGLFTWAVNVVGLYVLTTVVPQIKLFPYSFPGMNLGWVIIPEKELNVLTVAILASFLIGFTSHFMHWLSK
jgi:putative membrane protein